jgi:hypothetical protein
LQTTALSRIENEQQADAPARERLAQDLLFFCAQCRITKGAGPRLTAVHDAYRLSDDQAGDYEDASLGRIDPAWVAQAKRRVMAAKESWSSAAEGDQHRLTSLDEQFAALAESLTRLFPSGEVLAQTLQRAVVATTPSAAAPEIATLTPGEIARVLAWQHRLLNFTATPLGDIVAAFNRRNATQLVLADPGLAALRVNASLRSDNVIGFVKLLETGFGVRAERRGENEILLSRPP